VKRLAAGLAIVYGGGVGIMAALLAWIIVDEAGKPAGFSWRTPAARVFGWPYYVPRKLVTGR
jgi:hypothetical protein